MSLDRRYQLLDCSYQYNIPIIEEDWFFDLRYEGTPIPPLKALDKHKHVIYLDSFAMTFAPGMTFGYVVAPQPIIEKFHSLTAFSLIFVNSLNQYLMSAFIEKGLYEKKIRGLCRYYAEKRDLICTELERAKDLGISYVKPAGGFYVWCRLPDHVNQNALLITAAKMGINFLPGFVFFPHGTKGENYIRLCFSYPSLEQIKQGIGLLLQAISACAQ